MQTTLNYLHKFWNRLFAYRKDGEYTIGNLADGRAIRPLTVQRKNRLFFCSTKETLRSAVYNTFIETCKQADQLPVFLLQVHDGDLERSNGLLEPASYDDQSN